MRRLSIPVLIFMFAAMVLAGCGGETAATTTPAGAAPTTAPAAAASTTAATKAPAATTTSSSVAVPTTAAAATTAPSGTTAPVAASGSTIKIGMITSLTGPYNVLGSFNKQAGDLLVKQFNDAGGINGQKIELLIEDDQSNPSQGPIALKKLLGSKIVALIGPVYSSTCAAILDDVEAAKVPMITQCAADSVLTPLRQNVFLGPQSTKYAANQLLGYLKSEGKTKVTVLHDSTEYGTLGWGALKADASKFGITVDEQLYELTGTTFVPQLTKVKSSDAQALISWGSGAPAVTITKEYKQLGLTIPLLFSGAQASPLYLKPAGDAAEGVTLQCQLAPIAKFLPDSTPAKALVTKFDADFMAAYGTLPAQFAYNTYDAMLLFKNAITKANSTDPAKIREALEQTKDFVTADGMFNYTATDHTGLGLGDMYIAKVQNGALVLTKYANGK